METKVYKQRISMMKNAQSTMRLKVYENTIGFVLCWATSHGDGAYHETW